LKVTLSPKALEYVRREARYLKSKHPGAALQFSEHLKRLRQGLAHFPEMGKFTDEIPVPNVLRFVMGAYLVDYEISDAGIWVLAIRHGRERPPGTDIEDDFDFEIANQEPDAG
jgi:plasmid stabilization system protein ParE